MTTLDQHGNPMNGGSRAVELYDRALDRLARFHPDVVELASQLVEEEPAAPLGHVLLAYLHLMSTDAPDLDNASAAHGELSTLELDDRERQHADAIGTWLAGDWTGTSRRLDDLLQRWPTDLLALMIGHQLDFFLGDAQNLRDRVARSLPAFAADDPHVGFVHGMHSFGLEEAGQYERAETAGLAALDANPDDVWALHAVTHAYEMRGHVDQGIRFMRAREGDWGSGNLFTVHNWWHLSLFCLEAGDHAEALRIYDGQIHHADSAGVPLEMLDASALLWRLYIDRAETGSRFDTLADGWATRTTLEPWYAFNDLHAVMALAGAGRLADARAVISRLDHYLETASGTNARMTAEVGLPACRAVVAFTEDRHDDVVAELAPIRTIFNHFGGSHAQRDALQRTLLESTLRSGRLDLARALLAERLGGRETSVYGWHQQARLLAAMNDDAAAAEAADRAARHQRQFANALIAV